MADQINGVWAKRRFAREDLCPLDGMSVGWMHGPCGDCRYFRGFSYVTGPGESIVCNWPHDGSYVDEAEDKSRPPVPKAILTAFRPDDGLDEDWP